jgi:hypothetical protein
MNDREPPGKRTVEQSDELIRKSRRLIDELEFILEKLQEDPQPDPKKNRPHGDEGGSAVRST